MRGGIPNSVSPNMVSIAAPLRRRRLGALHMLIEGASQAMRRAFGNALVLNYYRQQADSVEANMAISVRAAIAAAAGQMDSSSDSPIGFSAAVVTDNVLHVFHLQPALTCFVRNERVTMLPDRLPGPAAGGVGRVDRAVEHYSTTLESTDMVALLNSRAISALSKAELAGALRRRNLNTAVQQLVLLLARRGILDCDVLVLHNPMSSPLLATPPPPNRISVPTWSRPPIVENPAAIIGDQDPIETLLSDEDRTAAQDARAQRILPVRRTKNFAQTGGAAAAPTAMGPVRSVAALARRTLLGEPDPIPIGESYVSAAGERQLAGDLGDTAAGGPGRESFDPIASPSLGPDRLIRGRRRGRTRLGLGAMIFGLGAVLLLVVIALTGLREPAAAPSAESPFTPLTPTATLAVDGAAAGRSYTRAQEILLNAQGQSDDGQALVLLLEAENQARQALESGAAEADVDTLMASIKAEQDRRNRVYRLATSEILAELGSDIGSVAGGQLDFFAGVYYVLNAAGNQLIEIAEPGEPLVTQLVDSLISPGRLTALVARPLGLLVISDRGVLLSVEPEANPSNLVLSDPPAWGRIGDADNFQNNLYRLAPENGQIYRYTPTALGYELEATQFLEQEDDISNAIDMTIDGDVYLLISNNSIRRYRVGQQVAFEPTGLDKPLTDATHIYTDQRLDSLYVVDAAFQRIVELDKRAGREGQFLRQFLYTGADDFFADIRGIWVDEAAGTMAVLGPDSLRRFVLPPIDELSG